MEEQAIATGSELAKELPIVAAILLAIALLAWGLPRFVVAMKAAFGNGNGHSPAVAESNTTHIFAHLDDKLDNILEAQETNRKEVRSDIKELFGAFSALKDDVADIDKRVVVIEEHRGQWDTTKGDRRARS